MVALALGVKFLATSGGTGNFTISTTIPGYRPGSSLVDGQTYRYRAESADMSEWEYGTGLYSSATTRLNRDRALYSSAGAGTKVSFTNPPQVGIIQFVEDLTPLDGFITGLGLSVAGASASFTTQAGSATDGLNLALMVFPAAWTKTAGAFVAGAGNGSLDTGAIAANTWYYVYLIQRTDTLASDILISLSPTAPTLPANYSISRRIGAMLTDGSAQWIKFIQNGDRFIWDTPAPDVQVTNPGTAAVLRTLSIPAFPCWPIFHARGVTTTATTAVATIFTDPAASDIAPDFLNAQQIGNTTLAPFSNLSNVRSNSASQIRVRSSYSDASSSIVIRTEGWVGR